MSSLHVKTQSQSYSIEITPGGLAAFGQRAVSCLGRSPRAVIVTNPTVDPLYGPTIASSAAEAGIKATITHVGDGEQFKTLDSIAGLYADFLAAGLTRSDVVLALGGGVVGDMAGFAAATYLRGIDFIQIPTTLLAMVDASVGGKTGVDLPQGKNLVGAFKQPRAVLIDPQVLATLPAEELASGMAEVIKHGLIGDPDLFDTLERRPPDDLAALVHRALAVKVAIVEQDTYERGPRALLNLGHTFGHALELLSDYRLGHGQAVALGLIAATRMSARLDLCSPSLIARVERAVKTQHLPTRISGFTVANVVAAMKHDKKRNDANLRFIVLSAPGETTVIDSPPDGVIADAVGWILED